jgi:hypothetical protein
MNIANLLGPEATEADVRQMLACLQQHGLTARDIAPATWAWLRSGVGDPPRSVSTRVSSTMALMEAFGEAGDTGRQALLETARRLRR